MIELKIDDLRLSIGDLKKDKIQSQINNQQSTIRGSTIKRGELY